MPQLNLASTAAALPELELGEGSPLVHHAPGVLLLFSLIAIGAGIKHFPNFGELNLAE
jgi:hypothetical protein